MIRFLAGAALLGMVLAVEVRAERPPEPREKADAVVVGTIEKITSSDKTFFHDGVMTSYKAVIHIDKVDRGDNLEAGKTVTVTWFHVTKRPSDPPPAAYGHGYKVKAKDRVRVWLMERGKDGYAVIYHPDGFEKLKK